MRAADVLGIVAGIAGGLPPLRLRKRRKRKPDPVAEAAAAAKRARRAAKRAEDERRTAEGREYAARGVHAGDGDWTKRRGGFWDKRAVWPDLFEPRWRIRAHARRARPGAERPWWASNGRPGSWSRGRQNAYVRALPGAEVPS